MRYRKQTRREWWRHVQRGQRRRTGARFARSNRYEGSERLVGRDEFTEDGGFRFIPGVDQTKTLLKHLSPYLVGDAARRAPARTASAVSLLSARGPSRSERMRWAGRREHSDPAEARRRDESHLAPAKSSLPSPSTRSVCITPRARLACRARARAASPLEMGRVRDRFSIFQHH